jgi:hypothetical protein
MGLRLWCLSNIRSAGLAIDAEGSNGEPQSCATSLSTPRTAADLLWEAKPCPAARHPVKSRSDDDECPCAKTTDFENIAEFRQLKMPEG